MKRLLEVFIVAFALSLSVYTLGLTSGSLAALPAALQGCDPGCNPALNGSPQSFDYVIQYESENIGTTTQKGNFQANVVAGAAGWQTRFGNAGQTIAATFVAGDGDGSQLIIFVANRTDDVGFWDPQSNSIGVPKIWVEHNNSSEISNYISTVMAHEFGHKFGFSQSQCEGHSIMSDQVFENHTNGFTSCDAPMINAIFAPRADNDSDGASPDDPAYSWGWDCNDNDANAYYGAYSPLCEHGGGNGDYNCNGIDDYLENIESLCGGAVEPLVIDVLGNGFSLTNRADGVYFDLEVRGMPHRVPWTASGSDDSWLALDRNGNGTIDDGSELFGDRTPQPLSPEPHGFLALAVFDARSEGGNEDGWIDEADAVFTRLRLWRDANHDGLSQSGELDSLKRRGLRRISLDFHELRRYDRWGNLFRYGARVVDGARRDIGPFAYDVFLGARTPADNLRRFRR